MKPLRISAISYLNTVPFTYGLQSQLNKEFFTITFDVPSTCAEKLIHDEADIGIVPVAMIPSIPNATIVTKYCIGAEGPVKTVILASNQPLESLDKIFLDPDSRSSVKLVSILSQYHWKKNFEWERLLPGTLDNLPEKSGAVLIGDKTFGLERRFKFVYDLAEHWIMFTGLPFVFACWIANKSISKGSLSAFESAIQYGINHREDAVLLISDRKYEGVDVRGYLMNTISYDLNEKKIEGMNKFLNYIR